MPTNPASPEPPMPALALSIRALIEISASTSSEPSSSITRAYGSGSGPGMTRASIRTRVFSPYSLSTCAMLTPCGGDFHQGAPGTVGADEIALGLEEPDGVLELPRGRLSIATQGEDLGEIGEGVAPVVDHVRLREERDGLAGERLRLGLPAGAGVHLGPDRTPEPVRETIVGRGQLLGEVRLALGLVQPPERVERVGVTRERRRAVAGVAELFELHPAAADGGPGGVNAARQRLHLPAHHPSDRDPDHLPELLRRRVA